jgi:hypothetical protein
MKTHLTAINRMKVAPALLRAGLALQRSMRADSWNAFAARGAALIESMSGERLKPENAGLCMALGFRIEALEHFRAHEISMAGTRAEAEADYTEADLVAAAADEPLTLDSQGKAAFEPQRFRRRLLVGVKKQDA